MSSLLTCLSPELVRTAGRKRRGNSSPWQTPFTWKAHLCGVFFGHRIALDEARPRGPGDRWQSCGWKGIGRWSGCFQLPAYMFSFYGEFHKRLHRVQSSIVAQYHASEYMSTISCTSCVISSKGFFHSPEYGRHRSWRFLLHPGSSWPPEINSSFVYRQRLL